VSGWVDALELLPGVSGNRVHVVDAAEEARIRRALEESGFVALTLAGESIVDDASFFRETARGLDFPDWFGANWDALEDSLADMPAARTAILWRDAHVCASSSLQTLLDATAAFDRAAAAAGPPDEPFRQVEVFLLGTGPGFSPAIR
jgi:RNAse (barnase) inhibitor barstar